MYAKNINIITCSTCSKSIKNTVDNLLVNAHTIHSIYYLSIIISTILSVNQCINSRVLRQQQS